MNSIQQVADMIKNSWNIVAFTGAGVSTESNIPDFRSSGGLYKNKKSRPKYSPEYMLSHTFFVQQTDEFYDFYLNNMIYADARPNDCHIVLAELERMGKLKAVITQNIDGLHQAAGSNSVLELHGSVSRNYCMGCKKFFDLNYVINMSKKIPLCDNCGGIVKPDVVLYEEMLDGNILNSTVDFVKKADVLLIIGTSLVVYPAAGLVEYYRGNKLILINKSSTPYDHRAKVIIQDSAGKVMREILERLQGI
jgi:NAD-dependent deacetylase